MDVTHQSLGGLCAGWMAGEWEGVICACDGWMDGGVLFMVSDASRCNNGGTWRWMDEWIEEWIVSRCEDGWSERRGGGL